MPAVAGHFAEQYTVQGAFVISVDPKHLVHKKSLQSWGLLAAIALMQDLCHGVKQITSDIALNGWKRHRKWLHIKQEAHQSPMHRGTVLKQT